MGADMLAVAVPVPVFEDGEKHGGSEWWPLILKHVAKTLKVEEMETLSRDFLVSAASYLGDVDQSVAEMKDNASLARYVRDRLIKKLSTWTEWHQITTGDGTIIGWWQFPRDLTQLELGNRWYWITGGVSWGDSPTDSYEFLSILAELRVFDRPIVI